MQKLMEYDDDHPYSVLNGYRLTIFIMGVISLLVLLSGCQQEQQTPSSPTTVAQTTYATQSPSSNSATQQQTWLPIIQARSQGYLSSDANIRVLFAHNIVDNKWIGQSAEALLSVKQQDQWVKGKTLFESQQEVVFIPEKPLKSGEHYTVMLNHRALQKQIKKQAEHTTEQTTRSSDASSTFKQQISQLSNDFRFILRTIPLDFDLVTDNLQDDPQNKHHMRLTGQLFTSDKVDPNALEAVLNAESQGKKLPVTWTNAEASKRFRFEITHIPRETYASDLVLTWNMQALGIKQHAQGKKTVVVPERGKVSVQSVKIAKDNTGDHVMIAFSDQLDSQQDLTGLVQLLDEYDTLLKKETYQIRVEQNKIRLYPKKRLTGRFNVKLFKGIRTIDGLQLAKASEHKLAFERLKPQVRFIGKGHILPAASHLEIPFEAVSATAVQVTAFEIFPDNVQQYLQSNDFSGDDKLRRVGRYLWKKTIPLSTTNSGRWQRYTLDATELLQKHRGSLMHLSLSIDRRHIDYGCEADPELANRQDQPLENHEDDRYKAASGWDGIENYFDGDSYDNYDYDNRDNPCTDSYFYSHDDKVTDTRNFMTSNIGLLAKRDLQGKTHLVATDLRTAEPLADVDFRLENFQGQTLATAKSDKQGFAAVNLPETPFLLIAQKNMEGVQDTAYLKLNAATALATSHFDVGGASLEKGLKGAIYGERGVWRPGDKLHLTFVSWDKAQKLPKNHPVTMKLFDPQGREVASEVNQQPVGGFYPFTFSTEENAPTGQWLAKAYLGGAIFSKNIMLETVRPNRLKIELEFPNNAIHAYREEPRGVLFSQWLHGGSADGLKADISVRLREKTTAFTRFADYRFDDPARKLDSEDQKLVEGYLDEKGYLNFNKSFANKQKASGMLSAWFTSRVFEKSGAFSTSRQFVDYFPYENYVGIKPPNGDQARNMLLTDQEHTVQIASVNAAGNPIALDQVQVTLYKIDWKWWWDKTADNLSEYADANHSKKLQQSVISTKEGRGEWSFQIKYPEWGRYLVRACDLQGQHCTGQTMYVDWPGWAGRAQQEGGDAASMLTLYTDKADYSVGETAVVQLPKATTGRALLTVETGSRILRQEWLDLNDERRQIELPITTEMSPNAYFSLSVLQGHQAKKNDRPIRLYGITPITVHDPNTHLQPELTVAEEWKPQTPQTITVSETQGKAMDYTLAIVDEGLLGLTRFKTPNLHKVFYQREKLGVRTWDLYDDVVGAYGGELDRLLALGGGDSAQIDDDAVRQRRFPPVVQFLGAFHLPAGEQKTHEINVPAYLGAVRVMLVAGQQHENTAAYGQAEQSVFVRQPLMVQASMPRALSVGDEVSVPVTVFAGEKLLAAAGNSPVSIQVSSEVNDQFTLVDAPEQHLTVSKAGEQLLWVKVKAKQQVGQGTFRVNAQATVNNQTYHSEAAINLKVRSPNPETQRVVNKTIPAGESLTLTTDAYGLAGTNHARLEISPLPNLHLNQHLHYLVNYPHGCLEQVVSTAFPQLYLAKILPLNNEQQSNIEQHIKTAIATLPQFKQSNGDFAYWPNGQVHDAWASLYAGHFLWLADQQGYRVPQGLLNEWLKYQHTLAENWLSGTGEVLYVQAYRLSVLAAAAKPAMGAMNRLRESSDLPIAARWFLASAYQQIGQQEAAKALLTGLTPDVKSWDLDKAHFTSTLGAQGQLLSQLLILDRQADAALVAKQIMQDLPKATTEQAVGYNTYNIAWALAGLSQYLATNKTELDMSYTIAEQTHKIASNQPLSVVDIGQADQAQAVRLENHSQQARYVNVLNYGVPAQGEEQAKANKAALSIDYLLPAENTATAPQVFDLAHQRHIKQGADVIMRVEVINQEAYPLKNLALTIPVAAGWEIHQANYQLKQPKTASSNTNSDTNEALNKAQQPSKSDYSDVRDDRVLHYFSLAANEHKVFYVLLNASYQGRYYQPALHINGMYDASIAALSSGFWFSIGDQYQVSSNEGEKNNDVHPKIEKASVNVERAWLYSAPNDLSKTRQYLIKDDIVEVLEYRPDWVFIRYKKLERWIKESDLVMG